MIVIKLLPDYSQYTQPMSQLLAQTRSKFSVIQKKHNRLTYRSLTGVYS
jgi:hypothetical protein